jgi:hypothetical protein
MRVLLISMPHTAAVIDYVARLPNLAMVSIAGNLQYYFFEATGSVS